MTTIYNECSKDELLQIVSEMQNDLNQAHKEIKLLNNQIGNLQRNVAYLCDENIRLRHELNEVKNNANNKIY